MPYRLSPPRRRRLAAAGGACRREVDGRSIRCRSPACSRTAGAAAASARRRGCVGVDRSTGVLSTRRRCRPPAGRSRAGATAVIAIARSRRRGAGRRAGVAAGRQRTPMSAAVRPRSCSAGVRCGRPACADSSATSSCDLPGAMWLMLARSRRARSRSPQSTARHEHPPRAGLASRADGVPGGGRQHSARTGGRRRSGRTRPAARPGRRGRVECTHAAPPRWPASPAALVRGVERRRPSARPASRGRAIAGGHRERSGPRSTAAATATALETSSAPASGPTPAVLASSRRQCRAPRRRLRARPADRAELRSARARNASAVWAGSR